MARLGSLQLLLPLAGDCLQPLAPLLQLPSLCSVAISSCQPAGGPLMQQLAAAGGLQQLSIQVSRCNRCHRCLAALMSSRGFGGGSPCAGCKYLLQTSH